MRRAAQVELTRRALVEFTCDWRDWLTTLFPEYFTASFAKHHDEFWKWVWRLRREEQPPALIVIWPRGGGKSVNAETAVVAIGAREARDYAWYCCETQEQADKHVETVAAMLESETVEQYYPALARRMLSKYGHSRGWRRSRLRASSGFTVDAIGLDVAARGARVEENRPGLIIFDDVDNKHDSPKAIQKKIETITTSLLPAGATDVIVLFVQNLITPDSIASQLVDGRAEFLANRVISGPHPAIERLTYEQREGRHLIVAGRPTWAGQDLETCQRQIDTWGLSAFLQEAQHEVTVPPGGMFNHLDYRHCTWDQLPGLVRIVVWVDPAVTATDQSDSMGIQADGIAEDGLIYRLWSWEQITSPEDALRRAILKAVALKAESVGVETDQGGDLWHPVYDRSWEKLVEEGEVASGTRKPQFKENKAGSGYGPKAHRASLMLTDYEVGRIIHVMGTHAVLERALNRFPRTKPFDLVDAGFWSWNDLREAGPPAAGHIEDVPIEAYTGRERKEGLWR